LFPPPSPPHLLSHLCPLASRLTHEAVSFRDPLSPPPDRVVGVSEQAPLKVPRYPLIHVLVRLFPGPTSAYTDSLTEKLWWRSAKRQNETTMSNGRLPPELLDLIVDLLQDSENALRNCCLVSKSWIPRTRKHLFADISFRVVGDLKSWKETFPDPSTSPSRYTKALYVDCAHAVTAADAETGGWIAGFSRIVRLEVGDPVSSAVSLVPFHGLSPIIKSLRVEFIAFPSSQMFDLVLSFPLLEDLTVATHYKSQADIFDGRSTSTVIQPQNPPTFTGSLGLFLRGGMGPIVHRLLSLPGGIHFWKLDLEWSYEGDTSSLVALVEGCTHTLESLDITCDLPSTSTQFPRPH